MTSNCFENSKLDVTKLSLPLFIFLVKFWRICRDIFSNLSGRVGEGYFRRVLCGGVLTTLFLRVRGGKQGGGGSLSRRPRSVTDSSTPDHSKSPTTVVDPLEKSFYLLQS